MVEVLQRGDRHVDDAAALHAVEIRHEGDAAGVVLEVGPVQPRTRGCGHIRPPACAAGGRARTCSALPERLTCWIHYADRPAASSKSPHVEQSAPNSTGETGKPAHLQEDFLL